MKLHDAMEVYAPRVVADPDAYRMVHAWFETKWDEAGTGIGVLHPDGLEWQAMRRWAMHKLRPRPSMFPHVLKHRKRGQSVEDVLGSNPESDWVLKLFHDYEVLTRRWERVRDVLYRPV